MPSYTNIIKKLSSDVPFVGPETQERKLGKKFKSRLGANESVFGPSESVINAMKSCIEMDIWKYVFYVYDINNCSFSIICILQK